MKKTIGLLSLLFIAVAASAQTTVKIEDIAKHEGDSVMVCTKIFGAKYFDNTGRTLLNAGAKYPDNPLTIMVPGESRANFKNKPEDYYLEKNVCIKGKVIMYHGKPEIIVYDETGILVE
jgi:hypothetical protein